jgi:hypothetical protein
VRVVGGRAMETDCPSFECKEVFIRKFRNGDDILESRYCSSIAIRIRIEYISTVDVAFGARLTIRQALHVIDILPTFKMDITQSMLSKVTIKAKNYGAS